jgi:hypothetical protein
LVGEWVGRRRGGGGGAERARTQGPGCCTGLLVGRGRGEPAAFFAHLTGSIERSDVYKQLPARTRYENGHITAEPLRFAVLWCRIAFLEPVNGIKRISDASFEVPEVHRPGAGWAYAPILGRVLRRGPPIRAAPGALATCTAVLFGVLEAYPPPGTTSRVPGGGELAVAYRMFVK